MSDTVTLRGHALRAAIESLGSASIVAAEFRRDDIAAAIRILRSASRESADSRAWVLADRWSSNADELERAIAVPIVTADDGTNHSSPDADWRDPVH